MRMEKHQESVEEVIEEVQAALTDLRGIKKHQRRLALLLSVGFCELIEIYFHKLGIIKSGSRIKHDWFRSKSIRERLEEQLIVPLSQVKHIDAILEIAVSIEESRDSLAYGGPGNEEQLLLNKVNQFLQLKKIIEDEVGDIYERR